MEWIPIFTVAYHELGTPVLWVSFFVITIYAAQRMFGGWFEIQRLSTANHSEAQSRTNATMLELIEKLNIEIKRLTESESLIMSRLKECEQRHRTRDDEFEKLQTEVAQLQVKLFTIGLGRQDK